MDTQYRRLNIMLPDELGGRFDAYRKRRGVIVSAPRKTFSLCGCTSGLPGKETGALTDARSPLASGDISGDSLSGPFSRRVGRSWARARVGRVDSAPTVDGRVARSDRARCRSRRRAGPSVAAVSRSRRPLREMLPRESRVWLKVTRMSDSMSRR